MSFDLEKFKIDLEAFGIVTYALIFDKGLDTEYLEFVVDNVKNLYAVENFGAFIINKILPYYSSLIVMSMDTIRLKGAFEIFRD